MSRFELVVLGSASQAPTRHRNHNGYAIKWGSELLYFDPGEGFQRQILLAGGVPIARASAVLLTHFHGDHCLGVPGLVAKRAAADVPDILKIFYPSDGEDYLDRMLTCTAQATQPPLERVPVSGGPTGAVGKLQVTAAPLDHRVTTYGYRVEGPPVRKFDREALAHHGLQGPMVAELIDKGTIESEHGPVSLAEVSAIQPGPSMAFIMDTRFCANAVELAHGVDLLISEATFLTAEAELAEKYAHMTASDAGRLAAEAGVGKLVLTHFSARYHSDAPFGQEASEFHADVHVASDFDRVLI